MKKVLFYVLPFMLMASLLSGCKKKGEQYTITWYNYDNSILRIDSVTSGETPNYTGETPMRESTPYTEYTFAGWTPEISKATQDTSYYATFSSAPKKYNITWINDDNSIIRTDRVSYGETLFLLEIALLRKPQMLIITHLKTGNRL